MVKHLAYVLALKVFIEALSKFPYLHNICNGGCSHYILSPYILACPPFAFDAKCRCDSWHFVLRFWVFVKEKHFQATEYLNKVRSYYFYKINRQKLFIIFICTCSTGSRCFANILISGVCGGKCLIIKWKLQKE